jgi:cytochrome oxidase Cu insertion factor (SCO1/SenC/PrrC family)
MKKFTTVLTAVLMMFIFLSVPVSTMAAEDPFTDAGFIQTKKQVSALDFTLEDLEGRQVQLSSFRGKVVMLLFWTTW